MPWEVVYDFKCPVFGIRRRGVLISTVFAQDSGGGLPYQFFIIKNQKPKSKNQNYGGKSK
jgi:hypothetical protein